MPKVSKDSAAHVEDHGPVEDRHEDVHGYTVSFVSFRQEIDATPLLRGLPDDRCQCPHWGYVLKGRLTFRFDDHDEVFEAGDAFYLPPGHVPVVEAGSEIVQLTDGGSFGSRTWILARARVSTTRAAISKPGGLEAVTRLLGVLDRRRPRRGSVQAAVDVGYLIPLSSSAGVMPSPRARRVTTRTPGSRRADSRRRISAGSMPTR